MREKEGYNLKYHGSTDMPSDQRLERDQDILCQSPEAAVCLGAIVAGAE